MPLIYKLTIEGPAGPEALPLARMARYLGDLAAVLGAPKQVRLRAIEQGSACLVVEVEADAVPKVDERLAALKQGEASPGLRKAYDALNKRLAEDQATAKLLAPRGKEPAAALDFTGQLHCQGKGQANAGSDWSAKEIRLTTHRETVQGYLLAIGGPKDSPRLTVEGRGRGRFWNCIRTSQANARKIAKHLYRPVRLHGTGDWLRDVQGEWHLKRFQMERFELLKDTPLDKLTEQLRAIKGSRWPEIADPDKFLRELRYGPGEEAR